MTLPDRIEIIIKDRDQVVYHKSCKEKINEFFWEGNVCFPDRYIIDANDFILEKQGKPLDMCSSAMIIMYMNDTEIKYCCEDLSAEILIWESGIKKKIEKNIQK